MIAPATRDGRASISTKHQIILPAATLPENFLEVTKVLKVIDDALGSRTEPIATGNRLSKIK
ncbi:hypothetical protein A6R70_06300 [Agrobacterium rubi]|nr:hypothetical protein [Agrobacterium rubi]